MHGMKTELLSPAGTYKNMQYAFAYGADAVYAGQPRYSLRVRENDFKNAERLAQGIQEAHRLNKLFFIASNLSPHNNKVKTYIRDLAPIIEMKPDALIMSDPGLIMMVREKWPEIPVHLSVQANAINFATVKFWKSMGLSRIILSRELSLDEVKEIRQECPDIELEVFVHGALCIAYSGRCLLSGYMTHRDSNQGACTNSCRWKYNAMEAKQDSVGDLIPLHQGGKSGTNIYTPHENDDDNPMFLLEEKGRPGELMPAYEDEHGTYIMNSKDLRAVQHVKTLIDMGIDSLKIEGRTKSHFYAARTTQVYRQAIDDAYAGREFNMDLMDTLEGLANRGFTEGFYRRHPPKEFQNYETGFSGSDKQQFVGEVISYDKETELLKIDVKNKFLVGDNLELMTPTGNIQFNLSDMIGKKGQKMDYAPGSGHIVDIPVEISDKDLTQVDFGLLVRYLPNKSEK
jgi:putative protease